MLLQKRGAPGEAEAWFEISVLRRRQIARVAADAAEGERHFLHRADGLAEAAVIQVQRRSQVRRLRQIGPEDALVIELLGARQLQAVAKTDVQREIRLHFPIVLDESRPRVPAIV